MKRASPILLAVAFFLWLGFGAAKADCPPFQTLGANGVCVCEINGNPPGANGSCPFLHVCLTTQSCCPPGQLSDAGECCPQGQMPFSDGSCVTLNQLIGKIIANDGLCPVTEQLQPNGTCLWFEKGADYTGPSCVMAPPLPTSGPDGGYTSSVQACCPVNQVPATIGVPGPGTLQYTGTCCPVGLVPQPDGTCLPYEPFVDACPDNAPFNAQTNSCCPPLSSITDKYVCCPYNTFPQPDGSCGCPRAQMAQSDGSCLSICPPNMVPEGMFCEFCPSGQVGTSQGQCCAPAAITNDGSCCPNGFVSAGVGCQRAANMRVAPRTTCAPGLAPRRAFAGDEACTPTATPTKPRRCSLGEWPALDGACCPASQLTSSGVCCPGGQTPVGKSCGVVTPRTNPVEKLFRPQITPRSVYVPRYAPRTWSPRIVEPRPPTRARVEHGPAMNGPRRFFERGPRGFAPRFRRF